MSPMTTDYEFWMSYDAEKEKLQIPLLPEKIQIKTGNNDDKINVVDLGEVTIPQASPATQISWESHFPAAWFSGMSVDKKRFIEPEDIISMILEWKNSDKPVKFISTHPKLNLFCRISSFSYREEGKDTGSYYYSITLKEYIEPSVRTIKNSKKGKAGAKSKSKSKKNKVSSKSKKKRINNKKKTKTYKVKNGDTLWKIAKSYYGSGSKYTKIYQENQKKIGGNPNKISVGMVLTIP